MSQKGSMVVETHLKNRWKISGKFPGSVTNLIGSIIFDKMFKLRAQLKTFD